VSIRLIMINIENLSKSYGDHILFDRMAFRINSRERIGLVGRNGHGKTTLFASSPAGRNPMRAR
jgi:ATPase subunit of ABC transporter with duplicated ATPase domains